MTVEQMTAIGEMTEDIIYNPVMYAAIFMLFLFLIFGGMDGDV